MILGTGNTAYRAKYNVRATTDPFVVLCGVVIFVNWGQNLFEMINEHSWYFDINESLPAGVNKLSIIRTELAALIWTLRVKFAYGRALKIHTYPRSRLRTHNSNIHTIF